MNTKILEEYLQREFKEYDAYEWPDSDIRTFVISHASLDDLDSEIESEGLVKKLRSLLPDNVCIYSFDGKYIFDIPGHSGSTIKFISQNWKSEHLPDQFDLDGLVGEPERLSS